MSRQRGFGPAPEPPDKSKPEVPPEGRHVLFSPASSYVPRSASWLWRHRFPLSELSVLAGPPGLGKSTLLCELAARLSRGELEGELEGEPAATLFATGEDSVAATLVPRLIAAGADLSRVEFISVSEDGYEGWLQLPDDIERIAERAAEAGAAMVVFDPLPQFLSGSVNSWRDADVRRALAPLKRLADSEQLAVVGVTHLNKATTADVLTRIQGSGAFVNAPRSVMVFAPDPRDGTGTQRVLVPAKLNLAPDPPSLAYRVEARQVSGAEGLIETSRLIDLGPVNVGKDDLLAARDGKERLEHDEAQEFLRGELANGPRPAKEVADAAAELGIGESALRRARKAVCKTPQRVGGTAGKGYWQWELEADG